MLLDALLGEVTAPVIRVTGVQADSPTPWSVLDEIMVRFPATRELVAGAAVLGQRFSVAALREVTGLETTGAAIVEAIDGLSGQPAVRTRHIWCRRHQPGPPGRPALNPVRAPALSHSQSGTTSAMAIFGLTMAPASSSPSQP
jgi:hypothetical protein